MVNIDEYLNEINELYDTFEVNNSMDERIRYTIYAISSQLGYEVTLEDYDTG